jgi:hypothetical protein
MTSGRATLVAALAVYPTALVFFAGRALMRSDFEELYAVVSLVLLIAVGSIPVVWAALAAAARVRSRSRASQWLVLAIAFAMGALVWSWLPLPQRQAFMMVHGSWLLLLFVGVAAGVLLLSARKSRLS